MAIKGNSQSWIRGLDSLRFVFALIVLLAHLPNPLFEYYKSSSLVVVKIFSGLLSVSFCGIGAVVGFFIISGFVIHYPNKEGIDSVKKFLLRRWLRIGLPLVVISAIGVYIDHFDFIPIWSLYCELIYYTIYPMLFKLKASWNTKLIFSYLVSSLLILCFAYHDIKSLIFQEDLNFSAMYWQFGPQLTWLVGLPCWLLGVVLAEKIDQLNKIISLNRIYSYRVLVFIVSVLLVIGRFQFFVSYILSMNLFALLLYHWLKSEIIFFKSHSPIPILESLGEFSYSIYLCHVFCIYFLHFFIPLNIYSYLIYVLFTLVASYAFHLIVEKPSHKLAKYLGAMI